MKYGVASSGSSVMGRVLAALSLVAVGSVLASSPSGAQTPALECGGQPATIVGTAGDDFIDGTEGPDVIIALQGNDTIYGLGGDDIICAGQGDDLVIGGQGFDILFGAQGSDYMISGDASWDGGRDDSRGARMFGGAGNDILDGSTRWDRIQGGSGNDQIHGYEGRDWIRGGPDSDYVDGGDGFDDLHGGNGRDWLLLSEADSVKGGAGLDRCVIVGSPTVVRSCESLSDVSPTPLYTRPNPGALGTVLAWSNDLDGDWGTKIGAPITSPVANSSEGFSQCVYVPVTVITLTASSDAPITDGFTIEPPQPVLRGSGAVLSPSNFISACDVSQIRWRHEARGVERSTITYDVVFAIRSGETIAAFLHGDTWLAAS